MVATLLRLAALGDKLLGERTKRKFFLCGPGNPGLIFSKIEGNVYIYSPEIVYVL